MSSGDAGLDRELDKTLWSTEYLMQRCGGVLWHKFKCFVRRIDGSWKADKWVVQHSFHCFTCTILHCTAPHCTALHYYALADYSLGDAQISLTAH